MDRPLLRCAPVTCDRTSAETGTRLSDHAPAPDCNAAQQSTQGLTAHLSMKLPDRTTPSFLSWSALLETWVKEPRIAAAGSRRKTVRRSMMPQCNKCRHAEFASRVAGLLILTEGLKMVACIYGEESASITLARL